jgi:glutaminyl-tRNA synthetase
LPGIVASSRRSGIVGEFFQFERLGYFVADQVDSEPSKPVFNRIVTLRDSWAKIEQAEMAEINR